MKTNDKLIINVLSIATIGAVLSIFIFDEIIIYALAFIVSAFSFYWHPEYNSEK